MIVENIFTSLLIFNKLIFCDSVSIKFRILTYRIIVIIKITNVK